MPTRQVLSESLQKNNINPWAEVGALSQMDENMLLHTLSKN